MRTKSLLMVGAAAMLALTGCSFSVNSGGIDSQKVQDEITKGLKEQADVTVTTSCPTDIPLQKDNVFQCTATTSDGQQIDVTVTQKDDEGNVRWEVTDSGSSSSASPSTTQGPQYLAMDNVVREIENGIQNQLGFAVTADCPDEVVIQQGADFDCEVTDDQGATGVVNVVMTDNKGAISWELVEDSATS